MIYLNLFVARKNFCRSRAPRNFSVRLCGVIFSTNQIIGFNNYIFAAGISDTQTFIAKYREESKTLINWRASLVNENHTAR